MTIAYVVGLLVLLPIVVGGQHSWVRLTEGAPRWYAFGARLVVFGYLLGFAAAGVWLATDSKMLLGVSGSYFAAAMVGSVLALIAAKIWKIQDGLTTSPPGALICGAIAAIVTFAGLGELLTRFSSSAAVPPAFGAGVAAGIAPAVFLSSVVWAIRLGRRGNYRLAPMERFRAASRWGFPAALYAARWQRSLRSRRTVLTIQRLLRQ